MVPVHSFIQIRGKHYLDASHAGTKKISSTDPLYEVIHLTVRRTNAGEMLNVNDVQDLPECVVANNVKGMVNRKG